MRLIFNDIYGCNIDKIGYLVIFFKEIMSSTTVLCNLTAVAQEVENMLRNYLFFIALPPIRELLSINMKLYFYFNLNGSIYFASGGYSSDPADL